MSGFTKPSKANENAFNRAVDRVTLAARELLNSLVTNAPPRNRETEAVKARDRSGERFGAGPAAVLAGHNKENVCAFYRRMRLGSDSVRSRSRTDRDVQLPLSRLSENNRWAVHSCFLCARQRFP